MNHTTSPQKVIDGLQTVLDAITSVNYELFTTVGDSGFVAGITKEMFEHVSEQLAPRMVQGYSLTYFGQLKQNDAQIYLWKLSFEDDGDEYVVRMTMKEDKVSGILIT